MRISACFPTLPNLSSGKPKRSFFKKINLSDILKTSCKSFPMKFREVNNFLRNYLQYFAKEVEKNFFRVFLITKEKDSIQSLKQNLAQFTWNTLLTVFATTKPRSEPGVVARLGLPDFAELGFVDFV